MIGAISILALLGAVAAPASELRGVAVVVAPPAAVETVSPALSLPVTEIAVAAGAPVAAKRVLVVVDVARLQRKLERALRELRAIQEERRFQKTMEQEKPRSSSTRPFEGPGDSQDMNRARREIDAFSDLREAQSELAMADVRAPDAGYVVEHLLAAGQSTRKRKPALRFVPLAKTRLTVTVDPAPAEATPAGREVVVVAVADETRRFRARVDSLVTTSASTAVYTLLPLELPFLFLDAETEVRLASAE